jgi:hypothetical protein
LEKILSPPKLLIIEFAIIVAIDPKIPINPPTIAPTIAENTSV